MCLCFHLMTNLNSTLPVPYNTLLTVLYSVEYLPKPYYIVTIDLETYKYIA